MKILLVDDEPGVLSSTSLLLKELGHETVCTADPQEVLGLMRKERPDVLLQDVRMPGLDLAALIRSIRNDEIAHNTPVLLFSASMDLPDVRARVGAEGFLEKPFHPSEVTQVLDEIAARHDEGGTA